MQHSPPESAPPQPLNIRRSSSSPPQPQPRLSLPSTFSRATYLRLRGCLLLCRLEITGNPQPATVGRARTPFQLALLSSGLITRCAVEVAGRTTPTVKVPSVGSLITPNVF
jgi:hypothetical protein